MPARYRIDPRQSRFTVQAFATGMLSLFAHSPLFAVREYNGGISFENDTIQGLRLTIAINANALELVDRVSAADRAEVESRMRNEVLETASYSQVTLQAEVGGLETVRRGHYRLQLVGPLTLHGTEHKFQADAELEIHDDNIRLRGEFPLRLSDYRIKQVTALGGTIKLKDELKLSFDVVALPEAT